MDHNDNKKAVKDFQRMALTDFQSSGVVGVGEKIVQEVKAATPIEPEHVEWIMTGKVSIYAYGVVTYEFPGGKGVTEFCYVYDPSTTNFYTYSEGNRAD